MAITNIYKGSVERSDIQKIYKGTTLLYEKVAQNGGYVRFVSASSRTITPKYTNSGVTLQYSVDNGATWTTITSGSATTSSTEHWFRGQATGTKSLFTSSDFSNAWTFSGSSSLEMYGNLNFLLCDTLGDEVAPTTLANFSYASMFYGCTSLTTPPELPATTLASSCYRNIFYNCSSLTTTPELPATTLVDYCYRSMFYGCTSLTTTPELPATTMKSYCYENMFYGCTSLTTTPELPATTLAVSCYYDMFNGCTSLTALPNLPATTLADYCYYYMFNGCSNIYISTTQGGIYQYEWRVPKTGTGTAPTYWGSNMLHYTSGSTATFFININTTYYVENPPV